MAIKHIIVLFVETPRKFITAKLSIRKPGSSSVLIIFLNILLALMKIRVVRIESFAVINFDVVFPQTKLVISILQFILYTMKQIQFL